MYPIIIDIDEIKHEFQDYTPEKAEQYQEKSAKEANKRFQKALKQYKDKEIILMSGGSASGKTEYRSKHLNDFQGIIFESTLRSTKGFEIKMEKIRKAKAKVSIHAIFPDSLKRAYIAFLNRERQFSDKYFYFTHSESRKTLLHIAKNYLEIEIKIFESMYAKNNLLFPEIKFHSKEELIEFLSNNQYNEKDIIKEIIQ